MNIGTDKPSELDEYELNAAVAECLMGMARGHCYGAIGGGTYRAVAGSRRYTPGSSASGAVVW